MIRRLSKSALSPILIGVGGYLCSAWLSSAYDFHVYGLPWLQPLMYIAIAVGLYLNVAEIQLDELKKSLKIIAAILCLGVPIKIIIPGLILSPFLSLPVALLCATVIAQIDPILAAKNIVPQRFGPRSATILRCWSSFDDPITLLFAFYGGVLLSFVNRELE